MNEKSENRRVKYTKMVLKNSLLKLMKDEPINKITVTDICKMADINRGTFYIHYLDAYDLLEKIENELYININNAVEKLIKNNENSKIILKELFDIILENKELCKILFSDNGDKGFLKKIITLTHSKVVNEWTMMYKNTNIKHVNNAVTAPFGPEKNWLGGHVDIMYNIINAWGTYNPDRVYSLIPYLGIGYMYGLNED